MDLSQDMRECIDQLRREHPSLVLAYGLPPGGPRQGPVVELEAWGESVAARLHERWGDRVALEVGAFTYPSMQGPSGHS